MNFWLHIHEILMELEKDISTSKETFKDIL